MLSCDDHAVAPRNRLAIGHSLDHTEGFVPQKVRVDTFLPMQRYVSRRVACFGGGRGVDMDFHGRSFHAGGALGAGRC